MPMHSFPLRSLGSFCAARWLALAVVAACPAFASAQEVLLRNDDLPVTNANAAIQAGFGPGEVGAATFTLTPQQQNDLLPMRIKRVQILWMSQAFALVGIGAADVAMESINVYRGGYSPSPLVIPQPVYFSDPPQLTDGFLNEFDIVNDDVVLQPPLDKFSVGLQFDNDAQAGYFQGNAIFRPSLVYDRTNNGQRNPVYTTNLGGWRDASSLGVTGDVVIRVVVEKVAPTACNTADVTAVGGPPAGPDQQLTVDDLIAFVNAFTESTGCPGAIPCNLADVTGVGGPPNPSDGQLTVDDLIAFVNEFIAGC